jgi:tripartite-type tricarboxylate transporter receptor subunit TctC
MMTGIRRLAVRRSVLVAALTGLAVLSAGASAFAQSFPTKPVKMVVPFAPGGATDTIGRSLAQGLSDLWGQPVIVENKPGANTIVGSEFLAKSDPDGYTIMVAGDAGLTHNLFLYSKLPYDPRTDFSLITRLLRVHSLLVVPTSLPVNNLKEFVALAKKNGANMNYGSPGVGDPSHIGMEWFRSVAGFEMVHVPYKGMGPALAAMLSGDIQALITSVISSQQHIQSGKIKPIVISGKKSDRFPKLPTLAEEGYPDITFGFYLALVAPAKTPPAVIKKIADDTRKVMNDPAWRKKYIDAFGYELIADTPEEFAEFYKKDLIGAEKRVKISGAKLD